MVTLPYMNQLPRDFYLNNAPVSVPVPTPTLPDETVPVAPGLPPPQSGGTYTGAAPPDNPGVGWVWLNPANNGLYVFTNDGVWTQIGTNW
jgi:hypothetical protein